MKKKLSVFASMVLIGKVATLLYTGRKIFKQTEALSAECEKINAIDEYQSFTKNKMIPILKEGEQKILPKIRKITSLLEEVELNDKLGEFLIALKDADVALSYGNKMFEVTSDYIEKFSQGRFEEGMLYLKEYIEKNDLMNNESSHLIAREIFDGYISCACMLKYTDPERFGQYRNDYEVYSKWYRNNPALNQKPESKSAFALMAFVDGDIQESGRQIEMMFRGYIDQEIKKIGVKITQEKVEKVVEEKTKKQSGEAGQQFYFAVLPIEYRQMIKEIGNSIKRNLILKTTVNRI